MSLSPLSVNHRTPLARFATAATVAVLSLVGSHARAEPTPTERSMAEGLFREGRQLVKAGRHEEACPKFAASQNLDPSGGTLLNLAICHKTTGKTATAWTELGEALSLALRDGHDQRAQIAREHLQKLEPLLSRIAIDVPDAARVPGLEIRLDGAVLQHAAWGSAMPFDPGSHQLIAQAPGHQPWKAVVTLGPNADLQRIAVPRLPEPNAPAGASEPPSPVPTDTGTQQAPTPSGRGPWVTGLAITGGVALAAGTYFFLTAWKKDQDVTSACPDTQCADEAVVDDSKAARRELNYATAGLGIGLVALGAAAYLHWTDDAPDVASGAATPPERRVHLTPTGSAKSAGLLVTGTW